MIRVRAASRLHFGPLTLPSPARGEGEAAGPGPASGSGETEAGSGVQEASPPRRFGGVGVMVQLPGPCVAVQPAPAWSAEGPLAERALAFARRFAQAFLSPAAAAPTLRQVGGGVRVGAHHILVEHAPPEHAGLGTGTQLALAVGRALAMSYGLPEPETAELARELGRGQRSALGIHGFAQGGFLVEAGKRQPDEIAPLVARAVFPESWRFVLVLPRSEKGWHGIEESAAFERLYRDGMPLARSEALCRLVLLGMLPALAEKDSQAFGAALYDFNRLVGEFFAPVQGGLYASPRAAALVAFIRQQGIRGAGQSSWGPTVFAVADDESRARELCHRIQQQFALTADEVFVAQACNHGAMLSAGELLCDSS